MTDRAAPAVVWLEDEPLSRHTALRTGGPCDRFVVVHDPEVLPDTWARCREQGNVTVLGAGTRLVVRDGGISGAVLRLGTGFGEVARDGLVWDAGAAVPVGALVAATVAAGCGGLEDRFGTPGSLGAALALDDGWAPAVVRYLHRGRIREGDLATARKGLIVGARFELALADPDKLAARLRERIAAFRQSWYAPDRKIRSVLGRCDVPGVRLRQVAIPEAAPEMMVNLGGGTAKDAALLHRSIVERVERERGIKLAPRVSWAGTHRRLG